MALGCIGGLLWHVLGVSSLETQIVAGLSGVLWLLTTMYRLLCLFHYRRQPAVVTEITADSGMTKLSVRLIRPVPRAPGKYYHVFFPGRVASYNYLYSFPAVALWYSSDMAERDDTPLSDMHDPYREVSTLSFLFSRRSSSAQAMARLQSGDKVLLDGPYGRDPQLQDYDNVILVAKGVGIAGLLSYALELTQRKKHDNEIREEIDKLSQEQSRLLGEVRRAEPQAKAAIADKRQDIISRRQSLSKKPLFRDATKRVILFWSLEDNSQADLLASELKILQSLDPQNVSLRCQLSAHITDSCSAS